MGDSFAYRNGQFAKSTHLLYHIRYITNYIWCDMSIIHDKVRTTSLLKNDEYILTKSMYDSSIVFDVNSATIIDMDLDVLNKSFDASHTQISVPSSEHKKIIDMIRHAYIKYTYNQCLKSFSEMKADFDAHLNALNDIGMDTTAILKDASSVRDGIHMIYESHIVSKKPPCNLISNLLYNAVVLQAIDAVFIKRNTV